MNILISISGIEISEQKEEAGETGGEEEDIGEKQEEEEGEKLEFSEYIDVVGENND